MSPISAKNLSFELDTPLGKDELLVESFDGQEGISRLFSYELRLVSTNDSIDFSSLLGKPVSMTVRSAGEPVRWVSGIASRFSQSRRSQKYTTYRMEVVPKLWLLTRTSDCRIFQEKSTPDIVKEVLEEHGIAFANELKESYETRAYCVQYRETDFAFISRLMEEEGIFWFFRHSDGEHELVLADKASAHKEITGNATLRYLESSGASDELDIVDENK